MYICIYVYMCVKDKQIATKEHKCPNKNLLDKIDEILITKTELYVRGLPQ